MVIELHACAPVHPRAVSEVVPRPDEANRDELERRRQLLHQRLTFVRARLSALNGESDVQSGSTVSTVGKRSLVELERSAADERCKRHDALRDALHALADCEAHQAPEGAMDRLLSTAAALPRCTARTPLPPPSWPSGDAEHCGSRSQEAPPPGKLRKNAPSRLIIAQPTSQADLAAPIRSAALGEVPSSTLDAVIGGAQQGQPLSARSACDTEVSYSSC